MKNVFIDRCLELYGIGKTNYRKLDDSEKYKLIGAYIEEHVYSWNALEPLSEQSSISFENFRNLIYKCLAGNREPVDLGNKVLSLYAEYFGDDVEDEFDKIIFRYEENHTRLYANY